jgi:serine phosphatase RsbU (regulator of sigma subunit)
MSGGTNSLRFFSRSLPGLAVLAYLSCSTLAPVAAVAATAKRNDRQTAPSTTPTASSTQAPQGSSHAPAAEHTAAAQGCCAAPPQPQPAGAKKHDESTATNGSPALHGPAAQHDEQGSVAEGQRSQSNAPGKRHHDAGGSARERSPRRSGAGRGAGEGEGQRAAGNEPQTQRTSAASRRQREKQHERQREKQREKEKRGKGKEEGPKRGAPEPVAGTPKAAPGPAASSAAHIATGAPAPGAPAPSIATSPAVLLAGAQAAGSLPSRRAPQRSHRGAGHPPSASLGSVSIASVPALAAATPAAGASAVRLASARLVRGKAPAQRAPSPLATTVTRLIGVVPPLFRILIGLLVALALALGVSSRLIALRARRLGHQRRQLLEDVGLLQGALLPALPGRLGPVGTSAAYRPASGPAAGGDFYDVFALADGQLAVIVGDVSGHGREALPHTTLVRFTLRAYLEAGLSPRGALQSAAPVLERQLGGSFATVVLATYNPRERLLVYACAGHPPPIIIGTHAIAPLTACSSPPIGAGEPTGARQTVVSVPGGALACFFTDGVVEARVNGELFGAERLERTLAALDPDASSSALLDRVSEQTDRRPDDMAACLLRIDGGPGAPGVQVEELELDRRELARDRVERFLLAGGVEVEEIGGIVHSAREAVQRDGGVVLELHLGDGSPRVALRQQNVTRLAPLGRASERTVGASR